MNMKKNIFALLVAVLCLASCDDYNKENFGIDDDANLISNVANYETVYAGEYPEGGSFTTKHEVDSIVSEWLMDEFYAADEGSTASITVDFLSTPLEEDAKPAMLDTLVTADYDAMGTEYGAPGKYDNFDSNMDINHYLGVYLSQKHMYAKVGDIASVTFKYYSGGASDQTRLYVLSESGWEYGSTAIVVKRYAKFTLMMSAETQQLEWKLQRLLGGSKVITMDTPEYKLLVDWTIANKPEGYLDTRYSPITSEYWFGSSSSYANINNNYYTWTKYYDPELLYVDLSDEEVQKIMDERLATGISTLILPAVVSEPNPDLSYVVVYKVYGGRGSGMYGMTFIYDTTTSSYVLTSAPVAQ